MIRVRGHSRPLCLALMAALLLVALCFGVSLSELQAQEKTSLHRTYADEQDAADQAYALDCGQRSLGDCNADVASARRRGRERAYRTAINAILRHLIEQGDAARTEPQNQRLVYLLGIDSEKADLSSRASIYYQHCALILSNPSLTLADIPDVVEDGKTVSVKSACETAAARLKPAITSIQHTETTVSTDGNTTRYTHDEDTWTFISNSIEPEPVEDVTHPGGLDDRPHAAGVGARPVTGERAADAATSGERAARVNDAAKTAKKQADAAAKAAKAAADAPEKAARKEERDRARAERAARKEEEAKEHEKKD